MSSKPILVDTTTKCLQHLYENRSRSQRLALDRLLGGFCEVERETVHRWQPSFDSLRGPNLLRTRCFLYLAGYEVTELQGMREPVRLLALIVGLKVIEDPLEVQEGIGFERRSHPHSLYRIIIRNESVSAEVAKSVTTLVSEHHDELRAAIQEKRAAVRKGLKNVAANRPAASIRWEASEAATSFDPNYVTAFWRAVGLTVSLGAPLAGSPEAVAMLKGVSAGGPELYELRELLDRILRILAE